MYVFKLFGHLEFMKNIVWVLVSLIIILSAVAYFTFSTTSADDSGWSSAGIHSVVLANNRFAFDMFHELNGKNKNENIFYSPYSISSAFAMVYEGARGRTRDEIKSVFHFPDYAELRPNFAKIYNDINGYGGVNTGNAIWVQKDFHLLENYTDAIKRYYGGKAMNLDFVHEPEKSRLTINRFIERKTSGKIKDLIPSGFVDENMRVVITNSIYFNKKWKWKFDPKLTKESDFFIAPNNVTKVQMMCMHPEDAKFNYTNLGYMKIIELPYKGNEMSMIILLPENGRMGEVENNLTVENFNNWTSQMRETKLNEICIPKFEMNTKYFMKKYLLDMGIKSAFSDADFSGMDGNKDLFISFVIHQAYVKVDESGTEAAAATAVGVKLTVANEEAFNANHPFIFVIVDKKTGEILFVGKVTNPSK